MESAAFPVEQLHTEAPGLIPTIHHRLCVTVATTCRCRGCHVWRLAKQNHPLPGSTGNRREDIPSYRPRAAVRGSACIDSSVWKSATICTGIPMIDCCCSGRSCRVFRRRRPGFWFSIRKSFVPLTTLVNTVVFKQHVCMIE